MSERPGILSLREQDAYRAGYEAGRADVTAPAMSLEALASPPLDVAQSYLTPLVHLPARRIDDPDDIPRCVSCGRWLTHDAEHPVDSCPVAAYLAALTRGDTR